jgi:ribosome-associated protein
VREGWDSLRREETRLTPKKRGGTKGTSEGARLRIKSSHEKLLATGPRKPRTKAPRAAPRAGAPRTPAPRTPRVALAERARPVRKVRPAHDAPQPDRDGAWSVATDSARTTATAIALAALDKKAVGVEILDVAGKVDYADFLVVMTGRSDRHAQALAQGIEEELKKKGIRPTSVEGLPHGTWVLMDFGDVVVHVFQHDTRQLYDIEGLWLDASRLPVPAGAGEPVA